MNTYTRSERLIVKILAILSALSIIYLLLKYSFDISDYDGFNLYPLFNLLETGYHLSSQLTFSLQPIKNAIVNIIIGGNFDTILYLQPYYLPYVILNYAIISRLVKKPSIKWSLYFIFIMFGSIQMINDAGHTLGYMFIQVALLSLIIYFQKEKINSYLLVISFFMVCTAYIMSYNAGAIALLFLSLLLIVTILILIINKLQRHRNQMLFYIDNSLIKKFESIFKLSILSLGSAILIIFSDTWFRSTFLRFLGDNGSISNLFNIVSSFGNIKNPVSTDPTVTPTISNPTVTPTISNPTVIPSNPEALSYITTDGFNVGGVIAYLSIAVFIILNILLFIYLFKKTRTIDVSTCLFLLVVLFVVAWAFFSFIRGFIGQLPVHYEIIPGIYSAALLFGTWHKINNDKNNGNYYLLSKKVIGIMLIFMLMIFGISCTYNIIVENYELRDDSKAISSYIAGSEWGHNYIDPNLVLYADLQTLGVMGAYHVSIYHDDPFTRSYDIEKINKIVFNAYDGPDNGYFIADTLSPEISFTWENWDKTTFRDLDNQLKMSTNMINVYSQSKYFNIYKLL